MVQSDRPGNHVVHPGAGGIVRKGVMVSTVAHSAGDGAPALLPGVGPAGASETATALQN